MKKSKFVILTGKPGAGKSTAWQTLRDSGKMKDWAFVDHAGMKSSFGKELGKKSLIAVLKVVMPSKKNIIIEEMARYSIIRDVGKQIKKYNYEIIVFQFDISLELSKKRDMQRVKDRRHGRKKLLKNIEELHKMHDKKYDKEAIRIDSHKLNKKQIINKIIKNLK